MLTELDVAETMVARESLDEPDGPAELLIVSQRQIHDPIIPDLCTSVELHGPEHPHTLISASNLAGDLRALGEHEAARELEEDTRARRGLG